MELAFLLVADYANTTGDGKLNVMGIFQSIFAAQFPVAHPEMYFIAQFTAGPAEYGRRRKLEIKLLDEDAAQEIVSFSTEVEIPRGAGGQRVNIPAVLRLVNTVFPKPGTYEFSVVLDEDLKGSLAIQVDQCATPVQA
jgi:hypothetical protein